MTLFSAFIIGLFVAMLSIQLAARAARRLQLLDLPSARKVHTEAIPRVGGIGLAIGALLPTTMWLRLDTMVASFIVGSLVIVLFGLLDDRKDLDFRWKIAGQMVAVGAVLWGGIVMDRVPFITVEPLPATVAYPLTALFILAITNAINLVDGLDGLAAGCALLTVGAIGVLGYQAQMLEVTLIAVAVMGAIVGFLRFNTHPALVFMGDAGSQFLGFAIAVLLVLLAGRSESALSPALPLLLLGMPIIDTASVIAQRLRERRSPFIADRNHIHHKLLAIGLSHHQAVSFIYLVQALMVGAALMLRYDADMAVGAAFLLLGGAVLALTHFQDLARSIVQRSGARGSMMAGTGHAVATASGTVLVERRNLWLRRFDSLPALTANATAVVSGTFLLVGAAAAQTVPSDIATVSRALCVVLVAAALLLRYPRSSLMRVSIYLATVFVDYLLLGPRPHAWLGETMINIYLVVLFLILMLAIRVTRKELFRITPQDFLVAFFALVVPNLSSEALGGFPVGDFVLRLAVVLYACEFVLSKHPAGARALHIAALGSFAILGLRDWIF